MKKKAKPYLWLDRTVAPALPFITLVRSEEDFLSAMAHCKVEPVDAGRWVKGSNAACCHYLEHKVDKTCVIVAIHIDGETPIQIACLLVHEAVHIVDHYFEEISERRPASEQRAYATQIVSQTLMEEYVRQIDQEFPE